MEPYSRFHSEVRDARARTQELQREAEERRLVRQLRDASPRSFYWRARLAARLHALAERLEPHSNAKGKLL